MVRPSPQYDYAANFEGHPDIVTFVGPLQLTLPVSGQVVDPESDLSFLLAKEPPPARAALLPSLRFWWSELPEFHTRKLDGR